MDILTPLHLFESREVKKLGFVLYLVGKESDIQAPVGFIAGVADTFQDFAISVLTHLKYTDLDKDEFKYWTDLINYMEDPHDNPFTWCEFWGGLETKVKTDSLVVLNGTDFFGIHKTLTDFFVDSKTYLEKTESSVDIPLSYIAKSIENDPSLIRLYIKEKKLDEILDLVRMDPKLKKSLVKFHNIKDYL